MVKCKLSVNVNKIATIRNARGGNTPNLVQVVKDCELFGAEGITVHPRPDERHITLKDVYDLADVVTTEFNIEGYPDERFMQILKDVKPAQATLVPDPPHVLTSNAGWDTVLHEDKLKGIIDEIHALGIRTSIFVETDPKLMEYAAKCGTDRVEFYTGPYAEMYPVSPAQAIAPYVEAAKVAKQVGLELNAGHDLSLDNLRYFNEHIEGLLEVSIGHALISDSLYFGLENTIRMYRRELS